MSIYYFQRFSKVLGKIDLPHGIEGIAQRGLHRMMNFTYFTYFTYFTEPWELQVGKMKRSTARITYLPTGDVYAVGKNELLT